MTLVTNNISRRRNTKKDIFTEIEDIEKRTEDIFYGEFFPGIPPAFRILRKNIFL